MLRLIREYDVEVAILVAIIVTAYLNGGQHLPEVIASAFRLALQA